MRRILTASLFVPLIASPAFAETTGMPQLDPTWFASQLFWLAVSFTMLYLVVSLFIAPRVGGVLRERTESINEAIALAEKFKQEAAEAKGNFEQVTLEAKATASQLLAQTQAEITKIATEAHEKLTAELEQKMAASEAELKKATTRALAGVEAAAVPLAQAMVEQLLDRKVTEDQVRSAMTGRSKAA